MRTVNYLDICAMKGNGSSMRTVLKSFIDKGATVELLWESADKPIERLFIVHYMGLRIPLRAYMLNFYSVFNAALSHNFTTNKQKSDAILNEFGLPTPKTLKYTDEATADFFVKQYGRVVVKPDNGAHGEGITMGITDRVSLQDAVNLAQKMSNGVLLQQQVSGNDHRLLFINYEFVAAVRREPASLIGDGKHSIRQLVTMSNDEKTQLWKDVSEGKIAASEVRGSISKTPLDEVIAARGEEFLEHTPLMSEKVQLLDKANVSLGGQTEDVTNHVNTALTKKISEMLRAIGLSICGVDVMSEDIGSSPDSKLSFIIELNAAPGLRLHELPAIGQPRKVCDLIVDLLIKHYQKIDEN